MAFEKVEKKINKFYKMVKKGQVTQEVGDEISNVINEIESLGYEAKNKFGEAVNDMKNALKKLK